MKYFVLAAAVVLMTGLAVGQTDPAAQAARRWRQQHERQIVDELMAFTAVPNVTGDQQHLLQNVEYVSGLLERRGITPKRVSVPGGAPVVVGELREPGATRTIVFYAHYDGQPLDPKEWTTPPFEPVLRNRTIEAGGRVIPLPAAGARFDPESRIYGRSVADDKAPIVAMLSALDAMRASGSRPKANIKFVFEGEEESSSVNLENTIAANRDLFSGDVWLICDGPVYPTRQQSVIFGSRGTQVFDVTVYGPRVELHSGHYGNWAPNPALSLARLLASMKDARDHVLIDGFYDQVEPLGPLEREAIARAPLIDRDLMRDLWLGAADGQPSTLNELIARPSLNIRGMASARIGSQATNVIPSTATATLDIRLVKAMDVARTQELVRSHVRRQGFFLVDSDPTPDIRRAHAQVAKLVFRPGVAASRTRMDLPIAQEVMRIVEGARGDIVKLPTMGGQVPLGEIERPLGTTTIVVPMVNHDNNQHSFDENLRIQNLWDGIELMAALLAM
jgi:acetylornithine deacetylase/succinyl-diaminopimelate desuccinylase-like protein